MARLTKDYSDAKKYLSKVLPWPQEGDPPAWIGITYKSLGTDGKKYFWSTRGVASVTEAVSTINWALGANGIKDIYVCMGSLQNYEEKVSRRGFKYIKAERSQASVYGLKSLYMDLDAKGGDSSYDTVEEAVTELFNFLKVIRFPTPSVMVRTGGGVHVYWTLDRILTPEEWLPLAQALVNAAQQHGLKFDSGCSVDYARVVRIPCTLNHKFTPPKQVELVSVEDFDYSIARLEQVLAPYKVAVKAKVSQFTEDPSLFNVKRPPVENDLGAGIETVTLPKPPLKELARACPFVRATCNNGGAGFFEPLWHNSVELAMWTEEGEAAAHVMSMGHADYTEEATTEKFDLAVAAQSARSLGWLQCATIMRNGAVECQTCPHKAKGKSPLNFTSVLPTYVNGMNYQGSMQALYGDILPDKYSRDKLGFISVAVANKDGTTDYQRVCDYVITNAWVNDAEPRSLNFETSTRIGHTKVVQVNLSTMGQQEMRRELQSAGVMIREKQVKPIGEFFVAWTNRLQQIKDAVLNTEPFGWSEIGGKVEGFCFGGTLYTPSGTRMAPITDHVLAGHYTPAGSLQPWRDAVDMIAGQNNLALDAVIAASFAAPLVRCTGQPGLLMSLYSLESGIGKTTAMKAAQAVWGDPVRGLQGLNDTQNAVLGKLGKLRALPMFWDELKTEEDARKMVNTFFTVTRGVEKNRMMASTALRDPGSWETLLVSASNESMVDYVVSKTKMTTAGIYRMFEFTASPTGEGQIAVSDAARIIHNLNTNFGMAGQVYAQFLGSNFAQIDADVSAEMLAVGEEVGVKSNERFWAALVAIVVQGARYANDLGLTSFNIEKLRAFMLDQFYGMRKICDEQSVDMQQGVNVANILVQFLKDMRQRNTLVTETMWLGRGKPKANSVKIESDISKLDTLVVHAATKDRRLRISISGLHLWLEKHQYPQHVFIEALKTQFGAVRTNGTLGAGTRFSSGLEYVIDIDMTHYSAKKYLQDLT